MVGRALSQLAHGKTGYEINAMKFLLEIDLPEGTAFLDTTTLGAISRVLSVASDSFDIAYDEQEPGGPYEVTVHELPWRWSARS